VGIHHLLYFINQNPKSSRTEWSEYTIKIPKHEKCCLKSSARLEVVDKWKKKIHTLIPRLKAHVLISDISAPTPWIGQIIKVLMLDNISSICFKRIDELSVTRIKSFIVNFSLKLVKFDISTCAFKRGIRVWN